MPSHRSHRALDRLVFGAEFRKVHHRKDIYAKTLGPSHRKIAHDPISNAIIAITEYPNDPFRAFLSAQLHDLADMTVTAAKRRAPKALKDALKLYTDEL